MTTKAGSSAAEANEQFVDPFRFYLYDEEPPTETPTQGEEGNAVEAGKEEPAQAPEPVVEEPKEFVLPENIQLPDDVDHGLFKGRKLSDVIEKVKAFEASKIEAETLRNQTLKEQAALRVQVQMLQEEAARLRTSAPQTVTQPQQEEDIYAQRGIDLERDWALHPEKVEPALRDKLKAEVLAEVRGILQQEKQQLTVEQRAAQLQDAAASAAEQAFREIGLPEAQWQRAFRAGLAVLTNEHDEISRMGGPLLAENWKTVTFYSAPAAPKEPAPEPIVQPTTKPKPAPNPPGETTSIPAATPQNGNVLEISELDRRMYREAAITIGKQTEAEIEEFIQRSVQDYERDKRGIRKKSGRGER